MNIYNPIANTTFRSSFEPQLGAYRRGRGEIVSKRGPPNGSYHSNRRDGTETQWAALTSSVGIV
ncbi:hypothetical protein J6590_034404 [Homalodisca vitripennis]|nr:hypothetical protein J6590_034404 [Homalodisca vitripennis]